MRRVNVDRMRKVNLAALYENFPRRWVTGLPQAGDPDAWLCNGDAIWTMPSDVPTIGRLPKATTRWTMRRAEEV